MKRRILPEGFRRSTPHDISEEYFINMGPQHPSTHGVLRLVLRLDGETVVECVPHLGYVHRGIEKQAESQSYLQFIHLTDRMDYICSHMNNHGVCLAIEQAMGLGVPPRAEFIRVIVNELQRIQSHLLFWSCFGGDMGAVTAFLYGFKEREILTDIFEELCGARLTMNYFRPGGCANDIPDTFVPRVRKFIETMKRSLGDLHQLLTENIIVRSRSENIGVLSAEDAIACGCSGPVARASGVDFDARRDDPYGIYSEFQFGVPLGRHGDCHDRYLVRMEEMAQSLSIVEQALDRLPDGPYRSKEKASYRLPQGSWYSQVETAKGLFGTYVVAESGDKPYRIKVRSPSFCNLSAIDRMVRGHKIADVVVILATIDIVVPDMDR